MELWLQIGETVTHAVVFLLFFWVMKRYVWPVVNAILEERQQEIEEGFARIERQQQAAAKRQAEYEAKLREIEAEARQKIQEGVAEGRRVAEEITANAQRDAQQIVDRAKRNIELEVQKARKELRDEIASMTIDATERLLHERLDREADHRLVAGFIEELERQ